MSDPIRHECAVAMAVLRKPAAAAGDYGGTKLSLLLEKQHNRGQDGAGAAVVYSDPAPGAPPFWIAKSASATPLADILAAIGKRCAASGAPAGGRIFLGHLRYATFGKNDPAFCHPFAHASSGLAGTLLLAGNFNLSNAGELFDAYSRCGSFPTSMADGYLMAELVARQLEKGMDVPQALAAALAGADGAWMLCGATGDGRAFATRDPLGIRPGFYFADDAVVAVASERPAIQAAFDVPPEAVRELPPGSALTVSPGGEVRIAELFPSPRPSPRPCSFERIYFSRANDAAIHRERKALGAALLPRILEAADAPSGDIFFSYIPNSARIAFHGLLEALIKDAFLHTGKRTSDFGHQTSVTEVRSPESEVFQSFPRFGEVIVKDAKFRTFIADAAARRDFYKHVYDVTYGLLRAGRDTLVVLDDSIVRGNTMKNAILPMLDRLGPKRIVIASSAPPVRYPDCYGIDMSTLGELVAFKALANLLGPDAGRELRAAASAPSAPSALAALYARFGEKEHCAEIARLLVPQGMKAEVKVVYQTVEDLRRCLGNDAAGDWYFTGDYPTPGGCKVLRKAIENHLGHKTGRSY